MKDFFVLKVLDRFEFIFKKTGIDYKVMRKLVQLKLTMDQRRVPTIMASNNKNNKDNDNAFKMSLLMYAFIGLFLLAILLPNFPIIFKMNIIFGVVTFMVMLSMISDFSTILLDVKDKNILLPRPISPNTINAAKVIHIFIYLLSMTFAIAAISLIAGLFRYGIVFFLLFVVFLVLCSLFVLFLTSILYFFILMFFDGEKLKDIINYFQIILSIIMVIGYQLMGRIFNLVDMNITYTPKWWHFLLPSSWFAAPFSLIIEGNTSSYVMALSVMGIVIPVISTLLYFNVIVPFFEENLQKLNDNSAKKKENKKNGAGLKKTFVDILCPDKVENTFFKFVMNMLSNERMLKLKLYPNLALAACMPIIILFGTVFNDTKSLSDILHKLSTGKYYIAMYLTVMMLCNILIYISCSERYKAAWVYSTIPLESPAPIMKSAVKAAIIKYLLPIFLLDSVIFLLLCGFRILPDLIFIFLAAILLQLLIFNVGKKELPFYKDFKIDQGIALIAVFGSMAFCGVFAVIHLILSSIYLGVTIGSLVMLMLCILVWKLSFNISWQKVMK